MFAFPEQASRKEIRPQPGPQEQFLSSSADIAIAGGAAGSGKSWGLLMEAIRHIGVEGFGAVIFRRTSPQITNEGQLLDTSMKFYPGLGGDYKQTSMEWIFPPHGCRVKFAHMEHEKNRFDWDGSQIALIGFDQLEHFTARMFWYMLSRNRSTCGVEPYIRATCNPTDMNNDDQLWLRQLLDWWIDRDSGYPIAERSGVIRWFVRSESDELVWADTRGELLDRAGPDADPKSITFIPGTVYDNKILLRENPEYLSNLKLLGKSDRDRLLGGNWNVRATAGLVFLDEWFSYYGGLTRVQPEWSSMNHFIAGDPAATKREAVVSGDELKTDWWTIVVGATPKGVSAVDAVNVYVREAWRGRVTKDAYVRKFRELYEKYKPIAAGIESTAAQEYLAQDLERYMPVRRAERTTDKIARAYWLQPFFEQRRIWFLDPIARNGDETWRALEQELIQFPPVKGGHDDLFDALQTMVELAMEFRSVGSTGLCASSLDSTDRRDYELD